MITVLIVYNILVFIIYGIDKYKAVKKRYRISERFLITLSCLMGCIGAISAMIFFRHKTKSSYFKLRIILSSFISTLLFLSIIYFMI
ncbi:MAG: DUF1294 domain-containing protein [Bacilli bacterium]